MRLVTVVGTRPEIIRLSRIIEFSDRFYDHILVHTGQNWAHNLNGIFFEEMGIRKPDFFLNVVGNNLGETMGNIISKSYDLFVDLKPDCLLILGDTNSSLCAISAKRLKIPIFHMEAGNRCFDQNVPEEINRKIVDHISDVNLCYTENSRRYLLAEGFRKEHIFVTGSPMTEVLDYYKKQIDSSNILERFDLKSKEYFLLSMHREENIDIKENFEQILKSLEKICESYSLPIIFSTHPRTNKKLQDHNIVLPELIKSMPALGFFDYCKLQINAKCVISDSGTVTEEASILNFPAVSFRTSTERPEGIDKGSIVISNIKSERVVESINLAIGTHDSLKLNIPLDYKDINISEKIIKVIQSYTPIINKVVWFKK